MGFRAAVGVPLIREGQVFGVLSLFRFAPRSFTEKQIELVETFADQAVIAIENTRLFNETREALERQTATADILKVIASSPSDVQPVFEAIAASANRLIGGFSTAVFRFVDDTQHLMAFTPTNPAADEVLKSSFPRRLTHLPRLQMVQNGETVQIADTETAPDFQVHIARARGFRSIMLSPLMSNGTPTGLISVTRVEPGPFADHHVHMLQTFADQAVIAIENVRLFDEVQTRTRELSQSVDELRALGEVSQAVNSTVDLETVLNTIVAKATQLSSTEAGAIYVFDQIVQEFHLRATYGMDDAIISEIKDRHIHIGDTVVGEAVQRRMPIQIPDIQNDPNPAVFDVIVRAGFRALLIVPLLGADRTVGALVVRRKQPGEFPKHTVDLLQTFAAQSVLAIQNARLFESVEARTRELAVSLEDLRAAQDRLVQTQKLASLGQLTAGIAHEIKNPLNFVNNFSAVSVELIDEMQETLEGMQLDEEQAYRDEPAGRNVARQSRQSGAARQARRCDRQEHAAALAPRIGRAQTCRCQRTGRGKPQSGLSRSAGREAGLQYQPEAVV